MKVNFITMQSLTELLKTAFSLSIFVTLLNLGSLNTRDKALLVNKFFTFFFNKQECTDALTYNFHDLKKLCPKI